MRRDLMAWMPVVLALCSMPACAPGGRPAAALLVEQSGTNADFGQAASAGAQLALARADLLQVQRSPLAQPMVLVERDTASASRPAEAAARALEPDTLVGIGLNDSDEALAAVPVFTRVGKPFMIIGATDPNLPNRCGPGTFLACFGDDTQALAAARFAARSFGKRCLLVEDSRYDYTSGLARYFRESFERLGGEVTERIDLRSPTAREALARRQGKPAPDFIFLSAEPDGLRDMLQPIRATFPVTPIMGGDGLDCSLYENVPQLQSEAVFFTTHAWFGKGATPEAAAFAAAYLDAWGTPPPNGFAALGYDAMSMVNTAVNKASVLGPPSPADIARAIGEIRNYRGASGVISYADGPVPRKDVWVVGIRRGERFLADRVSP
ncbi:MAG: ABC transporter substrate-binding protein [Phycisphaerales bacterium]